MDFKEALLEDLEIFFDEFAEESLLNGKPANLILSKDTSVPISGRWKDSYTDGIISNSEKLFVREKEIDFEPFVNQSITVKEVEYLIKEISFDNGLYQLIIEAYDN